MIKVRLNAYQGGNEIEVNADTFYVDDKNNLILEKVIDTEDRYSDEKIATFKNDEWVYCIKDGEKCQNLVKMNLGQNSLVDVYHKQ